MRIIAGAVTACTEAPRDLVGLSAFNSV